MRLALRSIALSATLGALAPPAPAQTTDAPSLLRGVPISTKRGEVRSWESLQDEWLPEIHARLDQLLHEQQPRRSLGADAKVELTVSQSVLRVNADDDERFLRIEASVDDHPADVIRLMPFRCATGKLRPIGEFEKPESDHGRTVLNDVGKAELECEVKALLAKLHASAALEEALAARGVRPKESWMDAPKVAVLELSDRRGPGARALDKSGLVQQLREIAQKTLPAARVLTTDDIAALLSAGATEGESEVDTGRQLGADLVVSGQLFQLGSLDKLALTLHGVADGRLIAGEMVSGAGEFSLRDSAEGAVAKMLGKFQP